MNDLIDRYVYAATRRLPAKTRQDVAKEIRTLIDDMLEERCNGTTPTEKDIRVVLTELGSPNEVYEKYDENATKSLIGPPYYSTYIMILKIVATCLAFGLGIANLVLVIVEPETIWYMRLANFFMELWVSSTAAFSVITLMFAIFSHKGVKIDSYPDLNDLPEVPKKKELISKGECIFGIVFSVLFTILFLVVPGILCVMISDDHEWIPIFAVNIVRSTWPLIVLMGIAGVVQEVIKLVEGRYNMKVLFVCVVLDVISAILTIAWFNTSGLINPRFIEMMIEAVGPENNFMIQVLSNIPQYISGIIVFAFLIDIITTIVSTFSSAREA